MDVPSEFRYLVDCFHQDSLEGVANEKQWIAAGLEFLDEGQKIAVRKFLDDVFARNLSPSELRRVWESADPDFLIPDDGHMRSFLQMIHDQL